MLKKAIVPLLALYVGMASEAQSRRITSDLCTNANHSLCQRLICVTNQSAPSGWELFAKVKFKPQLVKEVNEYFLMPLFTERIRSYEGTEICLEGYYVPMELEASSTIVLSKYPYSQCFFCGGAGPESVSEIVFASKPPKFKADQMITVIGTLKLNDKDVNRLNFIIENARVVKY